MNSWQSCYRIAQATPGLLITKVKLVKVTEGSMIHYYI